MSFAVDTPPNGGAMKLLCLFVLVGVTACAGPTTTEKRGLPELEVVESVELERYLGTWYEIASYPQKFQKGCTETTATYSTHESGKIRVLNRCLKNGEQTEAKGWARVVDTKNNAKLEVSFFRPFWGEYWIIALDPNYRWAVVGHPSRDYLWILARTSALDSANYEMILEKVKAAGYDVERLVETEHSKPD